MADSGLGPNIHHAGAGTAGAIAAFAGAGVYVPPCIVHKIEVVLGTASAVGDITYTLGVASWEDMDTVILNAFGGSPNSTGTVPERSTVGVHNEGVSPRGVELSEGGTVSAIVGIPGSGAENLNVRVFYRPLA